MCNEVTQIQLRRSQLQKEVQVYTTVIYLDSIARLSKKSVLYMKVEYSNTHVLRRQLVPRPKTL